MLLSAGSEGAGEGRRGEERGRRVNKGREGRGLASGLEGKWESEKGKKGRSKFCVWSRTEMVE